MPLVPHATATITEADVTAASANCNPRASIATVSCPERAPGASVQARPAYANGRRRGIALPRGAQRACKEVSNA